MGTTWLQGRLTIQLNKFLYLKAILTWTREKLCEQAQESGLEKIKKSGTCERSCHSMPSSSLHKCVCFRPHVFRMAPCSHSLSCTSHGPHTSLEPREGQNKGQRTGQCHYDQHSMQPSAKSASTHTAHLYPATLLLYYKWTIPLRFNMV